LSLSSLLSGEDFTRKMGAPARRCRSLLRWAFCLCYYNLMHPFLLRVIFFFITFVVVVTLPWWVSVLALVTLTIYFQTYFEILFFAFLFDVLYSVRYVFPHTALTFALVFLIITMFIKTRIRT